MQHILRRLILFLLLAATVGIFPRKAFATHLAGSDISYTCLGGDTFRIDLTFYRDCRSPSGHPNGAGIEFRSSSCNRYFTDTLTLLPGSGQEITYPCPGLTTACDDPNSPNPGLQEFKYSGIVVFPMHCADWVISWTYCCRNCDITTMVQSQPCVPGSNPPMYISAHLDNLNYTCNSSPRFTNNPIVFVCIGQNFTYNHGAIDPDGDSLVYSLVNPQINSTDSIPFIAGYSAAIPITSSPALTLNALTGDLVMTPTQIEVGVLSVLVQEYRNGILIGQVVRDMEVYIRPCTNIIPTATGINGTNDRDTVICPGTQLCFDVFSNDSDAGQIVTMTSNQAISTSTFTVSGFPYPTGHFCWTPGTNDISTIPHQFTVSVVDNACPNSGYQTYSFSITVTGPHINLTHQGITCNGLTNGALTVVPQNPGNYTYLWAPNGDTTSSISNLGPGAYSVFVYDSTNGCSANLNDTITNPPLLTDTVYPLSVSCIGSTNGSATVIASGGTPPYSYSWNTTPTSNNDTITGVQPGIYIVTITDSSGCVKTDSVTVNSSNSALVITVDSVSTLLCYTDTTGYAAVSVSGGTPTYSFIWNTIPAQLGSTATGLSPGSYIVTVTDSFGCSNSDTATVTSPPQLVLNGSAQGASCNAPDGIAIVTVTGGAPSYSFVWSGFPTTDDSLLNVFPGLYDVTVTDTNGCTNQLQVLVGSQIISTTAGAISQVGCRDDSNAVAVAAAFGGTAPYVYSWNTVPPQINDTATGLSYGQYIVSITDSNNCITVDSVNIPNPPLLTYSLTSTDASCAGDSTGTATFHVFGGAGSYSFSWSPYGGTDSIATQLLPGTYTVIMTDAAGCIKIDSAIILQNTTIAITVDSLLQPLCNGTNTGAIYISVTGGSGTYSYAWTPGTQVTQDISGITGGVYIVHVTDQFNCTQQQQINLNQPAPPPVFAGNDTAICIGNSIQLSAQPLPVGSTGTWTSQTVSNFSDINDPLAIVIYAPPGMNLLTWTVVDSLGCTNFDNVSIFNFFNNVSAGFDLNVCGLNPIVLNATSFIGFTSLWSSSPNVLFDNDTVFNTLAHQLNYGVDTLTWTISNLACNGSDYMVLTSLENPSADAGKYSDLCEDKTTLKAVQPLVGNGIWSVQFPQQADFSDSLNAITDVYNLAIGKTIFIWTVANGYCTSSDTVSVDFDEACEIKLPTGFSPNGDVYNEGYEIKGIEGYKENEFRVFNRWGNEVYYKLNYQNTDWVGQNKNGEELPEGTYFVILVIKKKNIVRNTYVDLRRFTGK